MIKNFLAEFFRFNDINKVYPDDLRMENPWVPQCAQKPIVLNWIPGVIYSIRGDDETG